MQSLSVFDGHFSENTEKKTWGQCPMCDMTAHNDCAGIGKGEYV